MSEINDRKCQDVVLKDRCEINVKGIESVDSFDEYRICATCNDGVSVVVEGVGLSVKEINLDAGYFEASGDIKGFYYDNETYTKTGFLKRLFSKQ